MLKSSWIYWRLSSQSVRERWRRPQWRKCPFFSVLEVLWTQVEHRWKLVEAATVSDQHRVKVDTKRSLKLLLVETFSHQGHQKRETLIQVQTPQKPVRNKVKRTSKRRDRSRSQVCIKQIYVDVSSRTSGGRWCVQVLNTSQYHICLAFLYLEAVCEF